MRRAFLLLASGLTLSISVAGQVTDHARSHLDTLSGFLVLRYDSCAGAWQYRGAQLIAGRDTISLSMMPAFYSPVYDRNRENNKWINDRRVFVPGKSVIKDRLLIGVYDRSASYSHGMAMDISNGLVQYGQTGSIHKSVKSPAIYVDRLDPELHRFIVLKANLVVLTLSDRMLQHINPDEYLPSFDLACYPEVPTSRSVIHKFLSTSNYAEKSVEALGLIRTDEDQISLMVYE